MKAIFFDLDNTLTDFVQMKKEACKAAVKAMIEAGLKMSFDEAYEKLMKTYFDLGLDSDRAFSEFLKKENQFDHRTLAAAINAYLATKSNFTEPYPNVKSVLLELSKKGIALAIVTDAPKTKAYQRLLMMGVEPYFSFVVGFEDTKSAKQTGLPIRYAWRKLRKKIPNIKESEVLFVGDSFERDLLPAKKIGLKTALSRYGRTREERGTADYELLDISDLLCIVQS